MIYMIEKNRRSPMPEAFKTWWNIALKELQGKKGLEKLLLILQQVKSGKKVIVAGDEAFIGFRALCQEIPGWGSQDDPNSAPLLMYELEPADEVELLADVPPDDPIWKYSALMIQRYGGVKTGLN